MDRHSITARAVCAGLLLGLFNVVQSEVVRFCVENSDQLKECNRFKAIPPLNQKCADSASDCVQMECEQSADCTQALRSETADLMMVSPLGLYYMNNDAKNFFQPIFREHRGGDVSFSAGEDPSETGLGYNVLAIVKRETCKGQTAFTLSSTKGYSSCHGDYGSMAGWVTPVVQLLEAQLSSGNSDVEVISGFYDKSCAPSNSGAELCKACFQDQVECDLTDDYAGAVGTLRCVRAGTAEAPRVGFVDHLTALGAGQNDSFVPEDGKLVGGFKDSQASQDNLADFRAVCKSGSCRGLKQAATDEDCQLAVIPADVAVMRATDTRTGMVRTVLTTASRTPEFRKLFGTSGNVRGALFSHGTEELKEEQSGPEDYIGGDLMQTLSQYDGLFSVEPQTDSDSIALDKEVEKNPVGAILIALAVALLVLCCGCCGLWCFCRKRASRGTGAKAQDPYMHKDPTDMTGQSLPTAQHKEGDVLIDES